MAKWLHNCEFLWHSGYPKFVIYFMLIMITLPLQPVVIWITPRSHRLSRFIRAPYVKFLTQTAAYTIFLLSLCFSSMSPVWQYYFPNGVNQFLFSNTSGATGRHDKFSFIDFYILFYIIGELFKNIKQMGTVRKLQVFTSSNIKEFIMICVFSTAFCLKLISHRNVRNSFTWWNTEMCGIGLHNYSRVESYPDCIKDWLQENKTCYLCLNANCNVTCNLDDSINSFHRYYSYEFCDRRNGSITKIYFMQL